MLEYLELTELVGAAFSSRFVSTSDEQHVDVPNHGQDSRPLDVFEAD